MSILNRNNFYNKSTKTSALIISVFYILFIAITPIINNIISFRNYNNTHVAKQYGALPNKVLVAKKTNDVKTSDFATYINNVQMLDRQIDNNNLQSYINDAKGSVLKLNDLSGAGKNKTYSYDAYGMPVIASEQRSRGNFVTTLPNQFQYNGERFDINTALQYLRARFYNPNTKRFINQDTYDLLNKFGYVDGNPVMNIDPEGQDSENWLKDALIAGGGIATALVFFGVGAGIYAWRNRKTTSTIAASQPQTSPPTVVLTEVDTVSSNPSHFENLLNQIKEAKRHHTTVSEAQGITTVNWIMPTEENLADEWRREYNRERPKFFCGNEFDDNLPGFIERAKRSQIVQISTDELKKIDSLSIHQNNGLNNFYAEIATFGSFPKFRNANTVANLADRMLNRQELYAPIVLKNDDGKMRILAGNTRMAVAHHLGLPISALVIDNLTTNQEYYALQEKVARDDIKDKINNDPVFDAPILHGKYSIPWLL